MRWLGDSRVSLPLIGWITAAVTLLACVTSSGGQTSDTYKPGARMEFPQTFSIPGRETCANAYWTGFLSMRVISQFEATYAPNLNCVIHIYNNIKAYDRINITVTFYDLETNAQSGCNDYLQFFLDDALTIPISGRICGRGVDQIYMVFQNRFSVVFVTDGFRARSGFEFHYVSYGKASDVDPTMVEGNGNTNVQNIPGIVPDEETSTASSVVGGKSAVMLSAFVSVLLAIGFSNLAQ